MGETIMTKPEAIHTLAVDADIIAYRCAAVCEEDTVAALCNTLDEFISNIAKDTGVSKMVMFISDATNFRYQIAKTKPYKGNRDKIIRPRHIETAKSYLMEMYKGVVIPNYEADDMIASYMTQHEGVAHAGIDKDIRQVNGWHYNFVKRIWEFTSVEDSLLKQYRQVCMGDTSDNIPGLPGIGEAKAAKAITDPYAARDDAIALYSKIMHEKNMLNHKEETLQQIMDYFEEQSALVTLVDTIKIPYEVYTVVEVKKMFPDRPAEDEDEVEVVNEVPENEVKPSIFSNSREATDESDTTA